jgi:hypothetical protein
VEDCHDCSFKTLMEETECMKELKSIVDYLNLRKFRSFQVSLKMDEESLDLTFPCST